jgi:hypothetical protein
MIRAGIPERVAMMVSGYTTTSVFERYNIVKDTAIRQAVQEAYLEAQMGTIPGTKRIIHEIDTKRGINQ